MKQTQLQSMAETFTNTGLGAVGSWVIVYACFHYIPDKAVATTVSVFYCTVWSLVRGYCVRRWFNKRAKP